MKVSKRVSTISLVIFIGAFTLSFIRWVACNVEREVVIEEPTVGLGNEATSDTVAPLLLQRSIEAMSLVEADGGVVVPVVEPVSEVELENARGDLEILDRTFSYNSFAGFDVGPEQYALLMRVHQEWQSARGRLFVAEKFGTLTPDEVSAGLDKADEHAYAAYQAILGADKVEMMADDMRSWGKSEAIPKLQELAKQHEP